MPIWGLGWLVASRSYLTGGSTRRTSHRPTRSKSQDKGSKAESQKQSDYRVLGVKNSRVKRRRTTPAAWSSLKEVARKPGRSRSPVIESVEIDDELAAVPVDRRRVTPGYSRSQSRDSDTDSEAQIDEETELDLEAEEKQDTTTSGFIEAGPHLDRDDPQFADWTKAEADLYDLLQDCGAEPMLPMTWKLDFPVLPDACFTEDDEQVIIYSRNGNNYHGIRALKQLFDVGARVRDRTAQGLSPTQVLYKSVKSYLKWAITDAGLSRRVYDSVLVVRAPKRGESVDKTVEEMSTTMHKVRNRYRRSVDGPRPVIFGIIIIKAVMTFVALDTKKDEEAKPKPIVIYDWNQAGQDVWHSMSVALLAMLTRTTLLGMQMHDSDDSLAADDPDA